jgi:hypothetical protein
MKVEVTLKDPDTLYDALQEAEAELRDELMAKLGLSRDGAEAEAKSRVEKAQEVADKYFKYGEYVTLIIDDEADTITVKPNA